jgi:hypothetical protein
MRWRRLSRRDQQRYRVGQRVGLTYAPSRPKFVRLDPPEWQLRRGLLTGSQYR